MLLRRCVNYARRCAVAAGTAAAAAAAADAGYFNGYVLRR